MGSSAKPPPKAFLTSGKQLPLAFFRTACFAIAMASDASAPTAVSSRFAERFRLAAQGGTTLRFDAFMKVALFDDEVGYYRRDRPRVGRHAAADFYTATSSGPLFGELVTAACVQLLGSQDPRTFTFVEVGAEPGRTVLDDVPHPFGATQVCRLGDRWTPPPKAVVFSNELFDAQPFRRVVYRDGAWREGAVRIQEDQTLAEVEWPVPPRELVPRLPAAATEGYRLDLPLDAVGLLAGLTAPGWQGLFIAFDYGKSWREMTDALPAGTARAYHQHQQVKDLLARPGEQDLTCHVCWDWLDAALAGNGFSPRQVQSQEAFFMTHAAGAIETVVAAEAERFSARKMGLMQLLHPGNMGQKFQVLWGIRAAKDSP